MAATAECSTCRGTGTVLVDASDRRKGERTCGQCGGLGEIG
jgi:hypothetical protein